MPVIVVVSLILACMDQLAITNNQSNLNAQTQEENEANKESNLSDKSIATLNKNQSEVEKIIKSFDYKLIESTGGDSSRWIIFEDWEKEQFDLKAKRIIKIKSTSPIKGHDDGNYYYRFAIWIEVYADEKKAEKRAEEIRSVPPHASAEHTEYFMAEGFRNKNIVYIVETDAVLFLDELGRFTKSLKKAIEE